MPLAESGVQLPIRSKQTMSMTPLDNPTQKGLHGWSKTVTIAAMMPRAHFLNTKKYCRLRPKTEKMQRQHRRFPWLMHLKTFHYLHKRFLLYTSRSILPPAA